ARPATGSSPSSGCDLGLGGWGASLEEQLLVDLPDLVVGGMSEQLAGHVHEGAQVALGMIAQGGDQLRGHQLGGAGLVQRLREAVRELVGRSTIESEAHAHAAAEREELVGPQALDEPPIAG